MPPMLFLKALFERFHDLVPVAQRFDLFHLFGAEIFLGDSAQPVFGDVAGDIAGNIG